jgi:hypothetical protein
VAKQPKMPVCCGGTVPSGRVILLKNNKEVLSCRVCHLVSVPRTTPNQGIVFEWTQNVLRQKTLLVLANELCTSISKTNNKRNEEARSK